MIRALSPLLVCLVLANLGCPSASAQTAKAGHEVNLYWSAIPSNPTAIAFDGLGTCYCLTLSGKLYAGLDTDGDDVIDSETLIYDGDSDVLHGFPFTGLTWHQGYLYMSSRGKISRLEDLNNDTLIDNIVDLVTGLPTSNHQNNSIVFDDNGDLLFSLGSLNDHGPEPYTTSATILKVPATGGTPTIWASGIRNAYGIAYKSGFGLVAVDNGPNFMLSNLHPPDELNVVEQGKDYGYPGYYGFPPSGSGTEKPVLLFAPHSAPCAIDFNPGAFSGWDTDVMVPFLVSPSGLVVRCSLHKLPLSGEIRAFMEPYAWGFQNPIDVKFAPDGSMIVADHTSFNLYRVTQKDPARIHVNGVPILGNTMTVELSHPGAAFENFGFFLSTSDAPVYDLGNGKALNLNVNTPLFNYCMTPGNAINYFPFPGVLDANGQAVGNVVLPYYPPLLGLKIHMAWVSWNSSGQIGAESAPLTFVVL